MWVSRSVISCSSHSSSSRLTSSCISSAEDDSLAAAPFAAKLSVYVPEGVNGKSLHIADDPSSHPQPLNPPAPIHQERLRLEISNNKTDTTRRHAPAPRAAACSPIAKAHAQVSQAVTCTRVRVAYIHSSVRELVSARSLSLSPRLISSPLWSRRHTLSGRRPLYLGRDGRRE